MKMEHVTGKVHGLLMVTAAMLAVVASAAVKPVEESKLFEDFVDPVSGVKSRMLKTGIVGENQQSIWFSSKNMTENGRFIMLHVSENEHKPRKDWRYSGKKTAIVDLEKDAAFVLDGVPGTMNFIDSTQNRLYYIRSDGPSKATICYRALAEDPQKEIVACPIPDEVADGRKVGYWCNHITLSQDRKRVFLDTNVGGGWHALQPGETCIQGCVNLETGKYESWGKTDFCTDHGQICPTDDTLAMVAWEFCWDSPDGVAYKKKTGWYPRMWLCHKDGRREMIPAREKNYASHEVWDDDGKGFLWCGGGIYHHDIATGRQECWCREPGAHVNASPDGRYLVYDRSFDGWWRGCKWAVQFYNRNTDKKVWIFSVRPEQSPKEKESRLHPDPHPHFVMNGRYVISTMSSADGHMDFLVTPVAPLVEATK